MNTESMTPETDAECFVNEGDFVTGDFARRLERERDELRERLAGFQRNGFVPSAEIGLTREIMRQRDEALAHLGSNTGHDCVTCGQAIFGALIGAGDGSGQQFAHPACYYRRQLESAHRERSDAEEERLRLEQELARVILQRQRLWEALADAIEHVPSTLQGRARAAIAEVERGDEVFASHFHNAMLCARRGTPSRCNLQSRRWRQG